MKIVHVVAALVGMLLLSGTPITAEAEESRAGVIRSEVRTTGTSLEITWGQPIPTAEADALTKSLQGTPEEEEREEEGGFHTFAQKPNGHEHYTVVKCSDPNRTFTDRNGCFDVRYDCRHNNVNWRFKVSPTLVVIATGPMQGGRPTRGGWNLSGPPLTWRASRFLGERARRISRVGALVVRRGAGLHHRCGGGRSGRGLRVHRHRSPLAAARRVRLAPSR